MKTLLSSLFIALASSATAQQYYDWQWKPCDPSMARFAAITRNTDSGWYRNDFFMATQKLQMTGLYKDSACKIKNGWFRYFYSNGSIESEGKYVEDEKEGLWLSYHPNGMMSDSVFYESGNRVYGMGWHKNGYAADSSGRDASGMAVHVYWFDNGTPSAAGRTWLGELNGRWQYFHKNGKLAAQEDYDNGKLVNRIYYNEEGVQLPDTTNRDRAAEFRGGNARWRSFMENRMQFPPNVKLVNTDVITILVEATIDEEGNVTDVIVAVPFNPLFDEEAVRIMKKSPRWIPAISHNRRVKNVIRQPIVFSQEEQE